MSGRKFVQKKSSSVPNQTPSSFQPKRVKLPLQRQSNPQDSSLTEQLEKASQFGYNGLDVPVHAPSKSSSPLQRNQSESEGVEDVNPVLKGLNPFKIQRFNQDESWMQPTGGTQIQRQPAPPTTEVPQSKAEKTVAAIAGLPLPEMLVHLQALDKANTETLLGILTIFDKLPLIDLADMVIAFEAVLGKKFSQSSLDWLEENSSSSGLSDQVKAIRDFMKPDAFDRSASPLIAKITQQIQQSYKKAIQDHQTNTKDAAKTTSPPALPADAQQDLEKLKILSPLAATQLQAVINAQGNLSKSDTKAHEDAAKAAGLNLDQQWCGGFAVSNFIPLQLSSQLTGVFWSTPKLLDFFNYQHGYDPYKWIKVGDEYPEIKTYHEQRGSLRKWLTGDQIHAGGELDIRPGDIVLQDNRDDAEADHIQMVQSWDPTTHTLFTIDGNGGGYQVDNRPIEKAAKDKPAPDDEKRKAIEAATGYRLGPNRGSGVVGLGSYDLNAEPTQEEVKKARQKGQKKIRIVGIGRPSMVDFETQSYLTKLPPKPKAKAKKP